MRTEYDVEAVITAVAEDGDPADLVFAALSYNYPQLGASLLGDPHPRVDLAVGHVFSSRRSRNRVWNVRLRLRAAADEDVDVEAVREMVKEKLTEALDSPADGEITEFTATSVAVEGIVPAGSGG